MGALGDGDEHNVHDADATNNQRNASNHGKNPGNNGEQGAGEVGNLIAISDREVIVARFGLDKTRVDGFGGFGDSVGGGGLDVDLLDLKGIVKRLEVGGINDGGVVKIDIIKVNRIFEFIENTDDDKLLAKNSKGFPERNIGTAEQIDS